MKDYEVSNEGNGNLVASISAILGSTESGKYFSIYLDFD